MSFSISKKFKNSDWTNLDLANDVNPNWKTGIEIISDRFNSRYFEHVDKLVAVEHSGFVIMAIDCLLIETLMQFYLGIDNSELVYKGEQWKSFRDFFKYSEHFQIEFKTNAICKCFYKHFRCGLLHQAQTKFPSLIKINQTSILTINSASNGNVGLVVDRKIFHEKMKKEMITYLDKLSNDSNNFNGEKLRSCAIKKMDAICTE